MPQIRYKLEDIQNTTKKVLSFLPKPQILLFNGNVGAGKTTFIKALAQHLGVTDIVQSPTFNLVNTYANAQGQIIAYHFDLYRIKDPFEALDMGFGGYLNEKKWVFIEWPQAVKSLINLPYTDINMHFVDKNERLVEIQMFC